jgi:hypothetical protein
MGVWTVSDAKDPHEGEVVFSVANTDNGLIALAGPSGAGLVFVTPETAERIRIHISAAIYAARRQERPRS